MSKKTSSADITQESRLKDQARKLHKELLALNSELTYAQVLEALSRSQGNRTLHVYQAQRPVVVEGQPLMDTARRMASRMFFHNLGTWRGKELSLLAGLDAAFAAEEALGSRHVEERVHELTQVQGPVGVRPAYEHLRHEEWKKAFEDLVAELAENLATEANLERGAHCEGALFRGLARDWRVGEGSMSADDVQAKPYDVSITRNGSGDQFYIDVVRPGLSPDELEGTPQMGLFIEVNKGLPCVHATNDLFGDQVLTVFFTEDGLYLRSNKDREEGSAPRNPYNSFIENKA